MSDPTQGGNSMSLDEAGVATETQNQPDLSQVKLDGDNVPEHLRGKTAADVLAQLTSMGEALKLSEQARKQAETNAQLALQARAPEPPPVEEPQELTEEALKELYDNDPLKAIALMNDQAIRRAEKNLSARLDPLFSGTAAQVEAAARSKYQDEFALFGDQITQMASQIPNAKAVLGNPAAWDDLVSLVRGRPGNLERLIEKKTAGAATQQRQTAQQQQVETMGFSDNGGTRPRSGSGMTSLDSIQAEIADKLGMSHADYIKWSKVG